jgi:integrase
MTGDMLTAKYRYVHEDVDRHGNVRLYVQKKGTRKIRIREQPGTLAFYTAYKAALDALEGRATPVPDTVERRPPKAREGTWRWLCARYMTEGTKGLDALTKRHRLLCLESTFAEPVMPGRKETFGDCPVDRFTSEAVETLRDRKLATPESANNRVRAIRSVFKWAVKAKAIQTNPARDVEFISNPTDGFHTWTDEEMARFEAAYPLGTKARLAYALLLYTGVRRSDVVKLGRQMVRDGWLYFQEHKGRNKKIKNRAIPILPELQEAIDAAPTGDLTFLVTERGQPFTINGFGYWFWKKCRAIELNECSAHGLRKAGATRAAERGATEHQLMAMYGWDTARQAGLYTRKADRAKLAANAMHLVTKPDAGFPPDVKKQNGAGNRDKKRSENNGAQNHPYSRPDLHQKAKSTA